MNQKTLKTTWARIATVRQLAFSATSGADTGWQGSGVGVVEVSQPAPDVIVYKESGTWSLGGDKQLVFTNVYRWTLLAKALRLEHLRFGADNPVYLFDLAVIDDSRLESVEPHV